MSSALLRKQRHSEGTIIFSSHHLHMPEMERRKFFTNNEERKAFNWVPGGFLPQTELICHCTNTEKERKGGTSGQSCL